MYCINCRKEIKDGSSFCSECGAAQSTVNPTETHPYKQQKRANVPYNTLCIIGIVLSAISLFWPLIGIGGFILSRIGLKQVRESDERGRELAIAGMVVGAITFIYAIVVLNLFMLLLS